jgi:hypothetical protein
MVSAQTTIVRPTEIDDVLVNPGMGIETFQRFQGQPLNEGVRWSEVDRTENRPQDPVAASLHNTRATHAAVIGKGLGRGRARQLSTQPLDEKRPLLNHLSDFHPTRLPVLAQFPQSTFKDTLGDACACADVRGGHSAE